jgi:oligopeptide/dipeptide ABC transporter ATP-binding protein
MNADRPLLEVHNLKKYFPIRGGLLNQVVADFKAVDDVSFSVPRGKTLGLVGESGSGKTTIGRCILRLIEPTAGEVLFDGVDITQSSEKEMRARRSDMQMIYQSPAASLNGRMTVGQIIGEPLWIHHGTSAQNARDRVMELMHIVGLKEEHYFRFPHEFSGGQQQRVGIARALAIQPQLLILDEPTSALDVSVQAQILNLLDDLQNQFELTYLFISHDLGVVRYMCDEVALLYLGQIVEVADVQTVFEEPKHPYTQALISAIPDPDPDLVQEEIVLKGDLMLDQTTQGCPFAARCHATKLVQCETTAPALIQTGNGHQVACHLYPEEV